MTLQRLARVLVVFSLVKDINSCNIKVCLTWVAQENKIAFRCKVNYLSLKVEIYDPSKHEQGHCLIPFPKPHCFPSHRNATMIQDRSTNITILTIEGHIDKTKINGEWKCTHGTNTDEATVNVTVLTKDNTGLSSVDQGENSCVKDYFFWTMIGFLVSFLLCFLSLEMYVCITNGKELKLPRFPCTKSCSCLKCYSKPHCKQVLKLVMFLVFMTLMVVPPVVAGAHRRICNNEKKFMSLGVFVGIYLFLVTLVKGKQKDTNQNRDGKKVNTGEELQNLSAGQHQEKNDSRDEEENNYEEEASIVETTESTAQLMIEEKNGQ